MFFVNADRLQTIFPHFMHKRRVRTIATNERNKKEKQLWTTRMYVNVKCLQLQIYGTVHKCKHSLNYYKMPLFFNSRGMKNKNKDTDSQVPDCLTGLAK
jgi:hypothetical protein